MLSTFINSFKQDKKELKEDCFTLVELGNEIYERRMIKKDL